MTLLIISGVSVTLLATTILGLILVWGGISNIPDDH
ncbi:hypothetical protein AF47_02059 [Klebsiella aerogenes MGH 61]|nr:hypothetical protein AF47_02059 [Klebsiella aerogenes MGH 61]